MKSHCFRLASLLLVGMLMAGCSSYFGVMPVPQDQLEVVLKENDFNVTDTHMTGTAECAYVIGIPLGDPNVLSKAEGDVRTQASAAGKPVTLVNWTKDETILGFLIYRKHKVTLTADAIEFTK